MTCKARIMGAVLCAFTVLGMTGCNQGDIRVTLLPAEAVDAGARWSVDGSDWLDSGVAATKLPVGDHVVTFKDVEGWTTPAAQTVTVQKGGTVEITRLASASPKLSRA